MAASEGASVVWFNGCARQGVYRHCFPDVRPAQPKKLPQRCEALRQGREGKTRINGQMSARRAVSLPLPDRITSPTAGQATPALRPFP